MPVEDAADRAAFFDEDAFAEPATYTPAGGAATPISVMFDRAKVVNDLGPLGVSATQKRIRFLRDQIVDPKQDDTVLIGGTTYRVGPVTSDITGEFWLATLKAT
ncbi:MAG: hypothetical protein MI806_27255 [Minwuiales bacterium]|nr:hypothetical protein [Minwuiales bacterium]